ncbi:MAG: ADP-ribosylglycohydrolase family protein [Pseudomonadota bacterium]
MNDAPLINRRHLLGGAATAAAAASVLHQSATASAAKVQPEYTDRLEGALYGLAIGDGMGAPVEGWKAADIKKRFQDHDFSMFLPPTKPELIGTNKGKGDGRITDDSLLLEALIRSYETKLDHLDTHDYAELFVPEYAERPVWVPERQADMPSIERPLWYPERYSHLQLSVYNTEPRRAGMSNRETQSYCGYVMPIGAVNAGDPEAAYQEAASFGLAAQTSYGLEAGAVTAASFAAAFAHDASVSDVIDAASSLANDGTGAALEAVLPLVDPRANLDEVIATIRSAYLPFSGVIASAATSDMADLQDASISGYGEPSRTVAIENPVVALALLKWSGGEFMPALKAAVFYGEDCESIAAHVAGLCGALNGRESIPSSLRKTSDTNNKRDRRDAAARLANVASEITKKDTARLARRSVAISG